MGKITVSQAILQHTRRSALAWVALQGLAVILLAVVWGLAAGWLPFYSLLISGLTCVVPNFFYAERLFARMQARNLSRILVTFYLGELAKLLIVGCLFVLVVKYLPINTLAYISGFIAAQLAFFIAPWLTGMTPKASPAGVQA